MKFNVVQSYLLRSVLQSHPALVDEVDDMLRDLPDEDKGDLYRALFYLNPSARSLAEVMMAETGGTAEADLRVFSSAEILNTPWPEPIWTVPELLPVGLVILAGAPKIGKSWLSLQLAKAVVTGGAFLNLQTRPSKALVCALEDSPQRLQNRMQAMGWPVTDEASDGPVSPDGLTSPYHFQADFLTLNQMRGARWGILDGNGERLAKVIEQRGYQLVVIDTLSRAIPGDQQDVQVMTRELAPLQEMSHELNCTIMLCDHHRKAGGMETDAIADILGSTAKGAMADTIWSLYRERGKTGAKLAITGRDVEEQTLQLTFNKDTCTWENLGETSSLAMTERRQEILDALTVLGRAQVLDLCERLKQERGNMHRRLQDLTNAGLVRRETVGGHIYYQAAR